MDSLNVEVVLKNGSICSLKEQIITLAKQHLLNNQVQSKTIAINDKNNTLAVAGVRFIIVDDDKISLDEINWESKKIIWHVYTLNSLVPQAESFQDRQGEDVNFATHYILPSKELFTLWPNLIYEENIKTTLLKYAQTVMHFAKKGVDPNIVSCNKVILLHGPPGTGKTSLCKAIAQKLSIRMQSEYPKSMLIEIDSHSLFSKWFSESGKMVTKVFERIQDIVNLPNIFVCVLIDEVESLAQTREQLSSGNDPSDALKVVNAVLTHIDQIRRFPNVLILTTSNITKAIDIAFLDRADIKQYIGPPEANAIKKIYLTCLEELLNVGVLEGQLDCPKLADKLDFISNISLGLSGRMLRKIPLLAHALVEHKDRINIDEFLNAMRQAVDSEFKDRKFFTDIDEQLN